jgi:monoamine oxidase
VDGELVPESDRELLADEVRKALDAFPPSPSEVVPAWAARAGLSPLARRMFCAQTGFNPVHEPSQVQMAMVEPPHVGRVCWMLADGTDSLAMAMAAELDVRLEQPARLVRRDRGRVVIETDADQFTADDVVVATPVTPTLRIGFDPVLPEWKLDALLATPMAQGGKVIGQYTCGAEIVNRLPLGAVSDGPVSLIWTRPPGPVNTVVVLGLMPDRGDGVLRHDDRALAALDRFVRAATGLDIVRLAGIRQDWTQEQYAGGVVSSLLGDSPRLPSLLAERVGRLHFAGEHTAEMWATSMDGALRSGERAADEILERSRLYNAARPSVDFATG